MKLVTFGEVMLRLAPEDFLRLRQVVPGRLESTFGGGELNVAVSVAFQGGQSAFMTASPDNPITDCLCQEMTKLGVNSSLIHRAATGRFGIYFVETGANQRGGTVTYDRDATSISMLEADAYDWERAFDGATWFHITGITPAISQSAANSARVAVEKAKQAGLTVSCDLNYRKKLWKWQPGTAPVDLARATMREMIPFVDVVVANEEDADMCLGIQAPGTDVESGELNIDGYRHVASQVVEEFPNVTHVAITLRESYSASHNNWGAMLYTASDQNVHLAPTNTDGKYTPYEMRNIVDRVGAGDSFAGGLIFALNTPELSEPATAIKYAVAASCLKHSIKGDFNYAERTEIEALMGGAASGRVQR
ncbi:MAG: carbohydrate kinase [Planctomycetaceae bacterium]|nr:carbohydrate kinase [Planctomycetaceae bacterium]